MMYDCAPDPNSEVQYEKTGYCGGDIVMRLIDNLPKQKGYKLVFDNYFNFIELLTKLKEQEIWAIGSLRAIGTLRAIGSLRAIGTLKAICTLRAIGTLRADRMRQCKLVENRERIEEGRAGIL